MQSIYTSMKHSHTVSSQNIMHAKEHEMSCQVDSHAYADKNKMPCYRKDDRVMRPIAYMGGLKIFGSPCIAMPI